MHGEMVEIDMKAKDEYPPHIEVCQIPEAHFSDQRTISTDSIDVSFERLHYKLVIEHKGIPYYEHLQSTSRSPGRRVPG